MKKIYLLTIFVISLFIVNIKVYAASASLNTSSGSVYVGDTFTVTANINSAAAWNVHVTSSGPVSGCSINQADTTSDAMDTNKTFSATCTATGEGTITLTLSGDVTSAEDGNAVGISGSKSVTVSAKPAPTPTPTPEPNNNNNNNSNNNSNNKPNTNNNTETKSTNNKIKELSVDGYKLEKTDDNNYTLSVPTDVTSIKINAAAEDSKATITGTGNHDLNVGENNIEVIVTSESGEQNKINIKVTRKDSYNIEDLESALKNDKNGDINITIDENTKISKQDVEKIKNSKKKANLNYYDKDKKLVYSLTIDGSKIKDTNEFNPTITFNSDNKKDILKLSNYADGLFINVKESNKLPNGTKIKLFVGDKYNDNDLVNVYGYKNSNNNLELVKDKLKVEKGYIEFEAGNYTDYLVTMSSLSGLNDCTKVTNKKSSILPIILGILGALLLIGIIIFIIVKKKNNNNDKKFKYNKPATLNNDNDSDSIIINNNHNNTF